MTYEDGHEHIGSTARISGFEPRVNSAPGGLMTSEDGRERIGDSSTPWLSTSWEHWHGTPAIRSLWPARICNNWILMPLYASFHFSLFCGHMIVQLKAYYPKIWCFDAVWKHRLGSSFLVDVTTSPLSRGLCVKPASCVLTRQFRVIDQVCKSFR